MIKHKFPKPHKKKACHKLNNAFSLLEYAILIAIIVAALIGMSVYLRRSLSGKWRTFIDYTFGKGRQYDPYTTVEW